MAAAWLVALPLSAGFLTDRQRHKRTEVILDRSSPGSSFLPGQFVLRRRRWGRKSAQTLQVGKALAAS